MKKINLENLDSQLKKSNEETADAEENMETVPELLPCPFCGGKAEVADISGYPFIYCTECNVCTHSVCSGDIKNAAMVWNTRYEDKKRMECQKCCHYDSTKTSIYRPKAHWCRSHKGWFENDCCCKYYAVNWMKEQEKLVVHHLNDDPVKVDENHYCSWGEKKKKGEEE